MTTYSHYDEGRTLEEHSLEVSDYAEKFNGKRDFVKIIGVCHDIAKATEEFQSYLKGEREDSHNHSPFGGVMAYSILDQKGFNRRERLMGIITVGKHHGNLPMFPEKYIYKNFADNDKRKKQIKHISQNISNSEITNIMNSVGLKVNINKIKEKIRSGEVFQDITEDVTDSVFGEKQVIEESLDDKFYDDILQLWASLVYSDKLSVKNVDPYKLDNRNTSLDDIEDFIEKLDKEGKLNFYRQCASEEVKTMAKKFCNEDYDVGTITLPTGLGKTLTGTRAAFTILEENNMQGRFVYCLPYTSILDQVAETYSEDILGVDPTKSPQLTIHHYLSETKTNYRMIDENKIDILDSNVDEFVAETWNSDIVLTTFVQIFESLAMPSNSSSMKLSNLRESVILLDEPQAIPSKWWPIVRRLSRILIENYDCKIITMTATHPHILENDNNIKTMNLVPNKDKYYKLDIIDRVNYNFRDSFWNIKEEPYTEYEELSKEIRNEDNVLVIGNTIGSTEKLYLLTKKEETLNEKYFKLLKERENYENIVEELVQSKNKLALVTARFRPKDRKILLEVVKRKLENNMPIKLISTQIVEAGVDISFEKVYRDAAPLDNIMQAAGRCNRNSKKEKGEVEIFSLPPDEKTSKTPAQYIYTKENNLLSITSKSVQETKTISEKEIREYYNRLNKRKPGKKKIIKELHKNKYKELSEFSLIDNDYNTIDIIVAITPNEVEKCNKLLNEKTPTTKKIEISNELQNITVSISPSDEEKNTIESLPLVDKFETRILNLNKYKELNIEKGINLDKDLLNRRFL